MQEEDDLEAIFDLQTPDQWQKKIKEERQRNMSKSRASKFEVEPSPEELKLI